MLQKYIVSLLLYGKDLDMILLVAIITLAYAQAHVTESTDRSMVQLLNYFATHLSIFIQYTKSIIIISIHNDASYLSEPKSRC